MKEEFRNYVKEKYRIELRDYQLHYAGEILDKVEKGNHQDYRLKWDRQTGKTVISWYLADFLDGKGYRCCFMSPNTKGGVLRQLQGFKRVTWNDNIKFFSAIPKNKQHLQGRSCDICFLEDPKLIDKKLLDYTIRPMAVNGFLVFIEKNTIF